MGQENCLFEKLKEFYGEEGNMGKLWTPGADDGIPDDIRVPNLLAIPNALVDLLQPQDTAVTPSDVLETIDSFIKSEGHPGGPQWDGVHKWCLIACQTGANGKSKVFLDLSPLTIDDEEFDRWVDNKLDTMLGPHPIVVAM